MRLIDADKMLEELVASDRDIYCKYLIDEQPTVEAAPVVHGEWLIKEYERCSAAWDFCSVCRFTMGLAGSSHYAKFCPNCGADMRKKVQE